RPSLRCRPAPEDRRLCCGGGGNGSVTTAQAPGSWRPPPGAIPDAPGVYVFRDRDERVIYVGKAKSLRGRIPNYFAPVHPRTRSMVAEAASIDWIVTGNEVEALQLEVTLIKEHRPRFNVRYRDDKSYPYLAVTLDEEI